MKNFLIILLIISPVIQVLGVSAQETNPHAILKQIGEYLNHQNFTEAYKLEKNLLQEAPSEGLAKDLSYYDFITVLQVTLFEKKKDEISHLISLREFYHPEDAESAAFLTRKDRNTYWSGNCEANIVLTVDKFDYAYCILQNQKISEIKKKLILKKIILSTYKDLLDTKDTQSMSDLVNLCSYYRLYINTGSKRNFFLMQKQLGKRIIAIDPHFVNGYFALISNSNTKVEQEKWISLLKKNYIGDSDQWASVVEPYISGYKIP